MKKLSLFFAIGGLFALDRATKLWVISRLEEGGGFPVWQNVFHITRVHNTGAAFGVLKEAGSALTTLSFVSVCAISLYLLGTVGSKEGAGRRNAAAWTLVAAGALGNLYDRLRYGHVIDFLDFRIWPVFNLADTMICTGVGLIFLHYLRQRKEGGHASHPV